jgi:hypothetical protein
VINTEAKKIYIEIIHDPSCIVPGLGDEWRDHVRTDRLAGRRILLQYEKSKRNDVAETKTKTEAKSKNKIK